MALLALIEDFDAISLDSDDSGDEVARKPDKPTAVKQLPAKRPAKLDRESELAVELADMQAKYNALLQQMEAMQQQALLPAAVPAAPKALPAAAPAAPKALPPAAKALPPPPKASPPAPKASPPAAEPGAAEEGGNEEGSLKADGSSADSVAVEGAAEELSPETEAVLRQHYELDLEDRVGFGLWSGWMCSAVCLQELTPHALYMRLKRLCELKNSGKCSVPPEIREQFETGNREELSLALVQALKKFGFENTKKVRDSVRASWLY